MAHQGASAGQIRFKRLLAFVILVNLPVGAVYADGIDWDFRGFGSIAGAKTGTDRAEYRLDLLQGKGADSDIDWGLHSNLGAQIRADFSDQFSVTGQAVAKRRADDDMDPDLEWLYASYRPASWFDLRAGRLVMPEFLISDYRSVGYAQPTIGPPSTIYVYGSITQFEGAQILNKLPVGDGVLTLQTSAGSAEHDFYFGGFDFKFEMENILGLAMTYERGNWMLRASNLNGDVEAGPGGPTEAKFKAIGAQYDNGKLFATLESIDRVDVAKAHYLMFGYRFGKWQPTVTYTDSAISNFFGPDIDSETTAFTLRYDMTANTAVKAQWEEVPHANFWMWLTDDFSFFAGDEKQEVVSFSLDFIF